MIFFQLSVRRCLCTAPIRPLKIRFRSLLCLSVFCALFFISPASPATYYVDCNHPAADDSNPGTPDLPLLHILKACDLVASGDSVIVRPGEYYEFVVPYKGSTSDDWITYLSEEPRGAVIKGTVPVEKTGPNTDWLLEDPEDPANIWFRVLKSEIAGFPAQYTEAWMDGVRMPATFEYSCGITYEFEEGRSEVRDDSLFVWLPENDDPFEHEWEVSFDYGMSGCRDHVHFEGFVLEGFGLNGIRVCGDNRVKIINNLCRYNGRAGISIISTGIDSVIIDGNESCYNCGGIGYSQGISVYQAAGPNNFVRNNVSHHNYDGGPCDSDGKGFSLDTGIVEGGAVFENNAAYENAGAGFSVNISWNGIFINNVSFNNLQKENSFSGSEFHIRSAGYKTSNKIVMRNNIMAVRPGSCRRGLGISYHKDRIPENLDIVLDHNLYFKWPFADEETKLIRVSLATSDTTTRIFDLDYEDFRNFTCGEYEPGWGEGALFLNPVMEGWRSGDFRISPESPAIDTGSDEDAPAIDFFGTPRPVGAGFDVGAHEYISRSAAN